MTVVVVMMIEEEGISPFYSETGQVQRKYLKVK